MAKNDNLHKAKDAKNDEFYTRIEDVAEELRHYKKAFRGQGRTLQLRRPHLVCFLAVFPSELRRTRLKEADFHALRPHRAHLQDGV